MLLNAFSRLADDFPEYKLAFIGDGDLRDEIKKAAEEKGLGDRVELNGVTNQVFERIHKSELYVMSSEYEGYPVVFIESMILEKPIITTDVSDSKQDVKDKFGIVVEKSEDGVYLGMKEYLDKGFSIQT